MQILDTSNPRSEIQYAKTAIRAAQINRPTDRLMQLEPPTPNDRLHNADFKVPNSRHLRAQIHNTVCEIYNPSCPNRLTA